MTNLPSSTPTPAPQMPVDPDTPLLSLPQSGAISPPTIENMPEGVNFAHFHSPSEALRIVDYIISVSDLAHTKRIGMYATWHNQITDKTVVDRQTVHGDPMRFEQGFPASSYQRTLVYSAYIDFIYAVILHDHTRTNVKGITHTVIDTTYDVLTSIVGIPATRIQKSYAPVLVTLDWDTAIIDPIEVKPIFKFYNIIEGAQGAYTLLIHHICTYILNTYTKKAILTFIAYGNPHGGEANLIRWLKQGGATVDMGLVDAIHLAKERTGLLHHVSSRIAMQVNSTVDQMSLVLAMAQGVKTSDVNAYKASKKIHTRFSKLQNICRHNNTFIEYMMVTSKKTYYAIYGPTATVTEITSSLNEGGGTSHVSYSAHSVLSETIINKISPLKRNIQWPHTPPPVTSDINEYNRIQINTTNWDDIQRIYHACPRTVEQHSKSYDFKASTMRVAVSKFYSSIKQIGTSTASMSYDALKGRGTYDVSYVFAST